VVGRWLVLLVPCVVTACASARTTIESRPRQPAPPVWLAIGQSNMEYLAAPPSGAGRVEVEQFSFEPQSAIPAWTPLASAGRFSAVAGQFGASLSALLDASIRVIAGAIGGTLLSCWERGGECDVARLAPLRDARVPVVGVIWWQGESEALSQDPAVTMEYETRLRRFFESLRSDFHSPQLPIVVVGLQRYCENWTDGEHLDPCYEPTAWRAIRAAQHAVASQLSRVAVVDVSDITSGDLHPVEQYPLIGRLLAEKAAALR
jgi:Carbohydrate esterase, sialic acid-specific acetylesterase